MFQLSTTPLQFKKAERYYHVHLQLNFFGGITIICSWGTFDSNRGGSKNVYCEDMTQVEVALERITATKGAKKKRVKMGLKAV